MSDFATDLKAHLKTITAITDIVGSGNDARIYQDLAPEGRPLPYILLVETGTGEIEETLVGGPGIAQPEFDVIAFGSTRAECNHLGEVIRENLHRWSGQMNNSTQVQNTSLNQYRQTGTDNPQDKSYAPRYWARYFYEFTINLQPTGA